MVALHDANTGDYTWQRIRCSIGIPKSWPYTSRFSFCGHQAKRRKSKSNSYLHCSCRGGIPICCAWGGRSVLLHQSTVIGSHKWLAASHRLTKLIKLGVTVLDTTKPVLINVRWHFSLAKCCLVPQKIANNQPVYWHPKGIRLLKIKYNA